MDESRPSSYPGVTLRGLEDQDGELAFRLFAAARSDLSVALADWGAAERDAFLRMQFNARQAQYARDYPDARVDIVVSGGEPIGGLCVALLRDELRIVDVTLLPSHRNRGIGSALLKDLLDAAGRSGRRVTLHVERGNPARHLYERLGFVASGAHHLHTLMEWPSAAGDKSGAGRLNAASYSMLRSWRSAHATVRNVSAWSDFAHAGRARLTMRVLLATCSALTLAIVAPSSPALGDDDPHERAASAGTDAVTYRDGRLSVAATDASLVEVVERIAAQAGFRVVTVGDVEGQRGSWSVSDVPLTEGLKELLHGTSALIVFRRDAGDAELNVTTVYLVESRSAGASASPDAQTSSAIPGEFNTLEPTLANQILIDETTQRSAQDRMNTIDRLAGLFDDSSVASLSFSLQHDPDPLVRARAVQALEKLRGRRAASALEPGLGDDAPSVRIEVVRALATLSDERVTLWLGQVIIGDSSDGVRLAAVRAVAGRPDGGVARHLLEAAAADRSEAVRQAATALLGEGN